jgi:hypothetical protein
MVVRKPQHHRKRTNKKRQTKETRKPEKQENER